MDKKLLSIIRLFGIGLCLTCLLYSCGTMRKSFVLAKKSSMHVFGDSLSFEQRRKFDFFFLEALRLKEKKEMGAAFEMYSHCLDIYPESAATLYELGKIYMYLGQLQKGEDMICQAMNLEPDNYWYKETLAAYYQNRGENLKAIDVVEKMASQFPSRLEPLMALADMYKRTQDYEKGIYTLERLERLDGKSELISMEKFRIYLAMDSTEQAFTEIRSLVDEYPYEMRYLTLLGDLYMQNDRQEEAHATYQQVLSKEPDYYPVRLSLAAYYESMGQDSLSKMYLDSLLLDKRVESQTKVDVMRQIIMRSVQSDSIRIKELFQSILAQEQENADIAMLASQYFLSKRMNKEVEPALWKVIEIDPENKPARLQLLSFAISKEDLDEIIRICEPAVEYMPESLEFYYYWGLAHYQKDQKDEALDVFSRGIRQVTPETDKEMASDFYSILGDLYHAKQMQAEAYAAYDSALVYKPDHIGVLNNYAYYLSLERKHLDKAEEMSYRTVKAEPDNATYLDTYAWILFEKGKYVEARIYIEQALLNGGEKSSVVVEHCGDIYYQNGEHEKAVEYWIQAENLAKKLEEGEEPRSSSEMKLLRKKIANKKYYTK